MPKQMIEVEVPEGYVAVKYAIPKAGERYLIKDTEVELCQSDIYDAPWIIVEETKEELPMKEETQEKPTVTVDCKIPEGFEPQGEFRKPRKDEWFLRQFNESCKAQKASYSYEYEPQLILKKKLVLQEVKLKLTPPEGFRFTGEYRIPETGDWYVSALDKSKAVRTQEGERLTCLRFILEKVDE